MEFTANESGYVPGLKDKFMLAHPYQKDKKISKNTIDGKLMGLYQVPQFPLGWWMSEKYDGQRALWDGTKFISRGSGSGLPRVYPYVPDFIVSQMPKNVVLDGEFFLGRNKFQELGFLRGIKKTKEIDDKWKQVVYQVFDYVSDSPFEDRMEKLKSLKLPDFVKVSKQKKITNEEDILVYYNKVISLDGEGLMIRAPKVPYIHRRTWLMFKLKPDLDAEAKVIGYKPGEGKYSGMLGALQLQTPSGVTFFVSGFPDSVRKDYLDTHPIGTQVTYRYTFLTDAGVPRHPRYHRRLRC
jgi:DNA ligase 1